MNPELQAHLAKLVDQGKLDIEKLRKWLFMQEFTATVDDPSDMIKSVLWDGESFPGYLNMEQIELFKELEPLWPEYECDQEQLLSEIDDNQE